MFLEGFRPRRVQLEKWPFQSPRLYLGQGSPALEVLVAQSGTTPRRDQLLKCWKQRHGGRAAPLLLAVLHDHGAWVCGPTGIDPPVYAKVDQGQLERICRTALKAPNHHAAVRFLNSVLPQVETPLAGLVNRGLLSDHVLHHRLPQESGWPTACQQARKSLGASGEALLAALGFQVRSHDRLTAFLEAGQRRVAVAVLLRPEESPDQNLSRFNGFSPVSYAVNVAQRHNLRYVVMVQDRTLRLYPAEINVGVGQRGRTETFIELHLDLLRDEQAGYLWELFSAEALLPDGLLDQLLEQSKRFAGDLAERFRERIYNEVVPCLARGVATVRHGRRKPSQPQLAETYEVALTILFRLLFIAYAEDKDLLPYEWNESYRKRSLKGLARELTDKVRDVGGLGCVDQIPWNEKSDALWEQVRRLFSAVEEGYRDWGVPIYDGRLFSSDPGVSRVGAIIQKLSLPDAVMGPVLCHLLLIGTPQGIGPVDFRSLSVREFGTIYEGLLESELSWAERDLVVDQRTGHYRPLKPAEVRRKLEPDVTLGSIYLHDRSGARKSTGSYYTKSFAVEHLLDEALQPALDEHLARIDALDDQQAAEALFDFRVADIAMGSGHFLVAALDCIERAFSGYLARRRLRAVEQELATLRTAANNELEKVGLADVLGPHIEDNQLLRRLIARRSIYGVDLNPIAVDLARLSMWVHTFVPGLPLSFLEHNLVTGNSLTGIGTLDEIVEALGDRPMFLKPQTILGDAREPLERLARTVDATPQDLARARQAHQQAIERIRPAMALCDVIAASRLDEDLYRRAEEQLAHWNAVKQALYDSALHRQARKVLEHLCPLHFPVAFPEVFLRPRSGFDCVLGNPPWEEATLEEHAFWARHEPGLRGLNQREQERLKEHLRRDRPDLVKQYEAELAEAEAVRRALVAGPYPGMGTGDPDLYKAFCWRFWRLVCAQGGRIGVVLPRSAWSAKGSEEFRREVFEKAGEVEITTLVNNRLWVFDDGHPQWTYALTSIRRGSLPSKFLRAHQARPSDTSSGTPSGTSVPAKPTDTSGTGVPPVKDGTGADTHRPEADTHRPEAGGTGDGAGGGTGVPPVTVERKFRRNLPHIQIAGSTYFLTWRCRKGITLSPADRSTTLNAIRHWHGVKWDVIAAVVMPDHVHVLATPLPKGTGVYDLSEILHSVKSFSAHQINKARGRAGAVWLDETYDRIVRDEAELEEKYEYIRNNPIKTGLAATVAEYPWMIDQEHYSDYSEADTHRPEPERHRPEAGGTRDGDDTHRPEADTHRPEAGGTGVPPTSGDTSGTGGGVGGGTGVPPVNRILLRGPFASLEQFLAGRKRPAAEFDASEVMTWTDSAALPLLPTEMSLEIFAIMRRHPRLDLDDGQSWRVRPYRELDATNDKKLMDVKSKSRPQGYWPVYKGESFDLWQPDRGPDHYYAWAEPERVMEHLFQKRLRASRSSKSPFFEFDRRWLADRRTLPCLSPRVAFRDVTNRTNQRTVVAALIPPKVFAANSAPFLLWARGDQRDLAFLLGVVSSLPLDWYARRVVETHVNFHVLKPFPIPRPGREDRLWRRVVELAGRLAAVDRRFAKWAKAVGVECGPLDEGTWFEMVCELDAVVAHLYGLEEKHLRHVFETFHEGWRPGSTGKHPTLGEFDTRLETTLEHFRRWGR